ncbi:MAG: hypothetical protein ACFFDB_11005 [Promethearchaeota archaeon]
MIFLRSEKITKAKNLIDNGEFEEALEYLNDLEQKEALTLEARLNIQGIKSYLFLIIGNFKLALQTAEALYQTSQEFNKVIFSFYAIFVKFFVFYTIGSFEEATKNGVLLFRLFNSIPGNDLSTYPQLEADMDAIYGVRDFSLGKYDQSLEYLDKCLAYYEKNDRLSFMIPLVLYSKGWVNFFKGELNLALQCGERGISLISKPYYHDPLYWKAEIYRLIGSIYFLKGDLDRALEYQIGNLEIYKKFEGEYFNPTWWTNAYYVIIRTFLLKRENDEVQRYFHEFKLFKEKYESRADLDYMYQVTAALILKSSGRMRDRVEAETILKNLIEKGEHGLTYMALINLCDIYFQEFQLTNQMDILDDIHPLIDHLQRYAIRYRSYRHLTNVKLFQAKLALLQINLVEARRLLTEAQQIADEHGLQLLANEISREHDKLLEELKLWESFKKTQASMEERLKLASFEGVLERLQDRGVIEAPELEDEEPILLLIMDSSGVTYFNYPFLPDWDYSDLFSAFMSAFNTFSDEIFSKSIDRIKIGENTILINPIEPFLTCYVIKGKSYPALQKLTRFSEAIRANSEIWQTLNKSVKTSEMLEIDKPPALKTVIDEIF